MKKLLLILCLVVTGQVFANPNIFIENDTAKAKMVIISVYGESEAECISIRDEFISNQLDAKQKIVTQVGECTKTKRGKVLGKKRASYSSKIVFLN